MTLNEQLLRRELLRERSRVRRSLRPRPKLAMWSIEAALLDILDARGSEASTEPWLEVASGLSAVSFKEAIIRLLRKRLVVKWTNEKFERFVVNAKYAHTAYYTEIVSINPIYAFFGHGQLDVPVQRTIPFVGLADEEDGKVKLNRYRLQDTRLDKLDGNMVA